MERLDEELQATRKGERTQGPEAEAEAEQVLNATHRQMQQGAAGSCDASGERTQGPACCGCSTATRLLCRHHHGLEGRQKKKLAGNCTLASPSSPVLGAPRTVRLPDEHGSARPR